MTPATVTRAEYQKALRTAKAAKNRATEDGAKAELAQALQRAGLAVPEWEHRFEPARKWRFDGAYPALMIGIEIEGGTHSRGRHTRHSGFEADAEKYNRAAALGWCVLRFTYGMIRDSRAVETIRLAVTMRLSAPVR